MRTIIVSHQHNGVYREAALVRTQEEREAEYARILRIASEPMQRRDPKRIKPDLSVSPTA